MKPHDHAWIVDEGGQRERRTLAVVALTAVTMLVELVAGWVFGSMALLADGWHMASHAAALGVSVAAYVVARRHASDPRFTFGTGKVTSLGGFASAVALAIVALLMGAESVRRLMGPLDIQFDRALMVACLGLVVNLVSAWLLSDGHDHHHHGHDHHGHDHHGHDHHGHDHDHHTDHNYRAAYLHVLADALTSVMAIVALLAGRHLGWAWMDPAMGIVGMVVIGRWSIGLMWGSGRALLDFQQREALKNSARSALEGDDDTEVVDLHVWTVAPGHVAVLASVNAPHGVAALDYHRRLAAAHDFAHVTVEVHERSRA